MKNLICLFTLLCGLSVEAVPTQGHRILISAAHPLAVEAGRKVAERGGNVVDVAVTVALTLSVTSPSFSALGGGGFALTKLKGMPSPEALDFREMAPAATSRDYYLKLAKDASITGGHAVGVPGKAAGLVALHKKYGKLRWASLFADPIRLARQGFPVSGEWSDETARDKDRFNPAGRKILFKTGGVAYKPGELLKQPGLARALEALRDRREKGFYEGEVAKDVVAAVAESGGKMTLQDLKNYKVRWLKPLQTEYEGYKIYLMPPPSSGGIVIMQALKLIEALDLKSKAALSVDELHLLAEIQARAFRGRALLGDPDFHKNPIDFLTSKTYLKELAESVKLKKAVALKPLAEDVSKESTQTTHFSVLDHEGNAVALTETLNGSYGSAVVTPRYGIALNNEMDDFTTRPGEPNMFGLIQGSGNEVAAGKRPLSSMSPTLVEKEGRIVMSVGAPGGPRIITAVLQVLYRTLSRKTDVDWAIQAPRVHHQFLPNQVTVDFNRLPPESVQGLKDRGHTVEEGWMGRVYLVRLRPDGILEAAFDSRGEGSAGGI